MSANSTENTTTTTAAAATTGQAATAETGTANTAAEDTAAQALLNQWTNDTDDDEQLGEAGKKALEAERTRATEADKKARALQRELDTLKRNALPDAERAAADAEARGRTAAQVEFGQQLARSEFAIEAAKIDPAFQVSTIADDVNWARFVGPDGERDTAGIAAAAKRLVPKPAAGAPSFDGGARTASKTTDMNDLIRNASRR